jgi:hypothetical protein
LRIYEDLNIGQHTVLGLDEYVLWIVLAGGGMTRSPAESDLNVFDGESRRRFGISMRAVKHQKLPQFTGRD